MAKPAISVVIPAFNEEENVEPQTGEIIATLDEYPGGFELIFVDDGSSDGTAAEVDKASKADPRVRLLKLTENIGQVPAMVEGIASAKGEVVVTLDGDRQHDPEDIPALVAGVRSGADMVCGWRKDRQDPYIGKILPSWIFNRVLRGMFKVPIHDASCTMRAFSPDVVLALSLYRDSISFIPIFVALSGKDVREMIIRHRPRTLGEAKYNSPGRFLYTIREMIAIYRGKRNHCLPSGQ